MLGVRVSPDIQLAPRASSISYSANSAEAGSVSRSMLSAPISTSLPAKVSPVNHTSASPNVGLDKTASLHSSNIVNLSRGPANLAIDDNSALVSQSISRASDTNLSVNLSGSNSSQASFSLNLGPLTVSGLVSPKKQAIELSPRFSSHSVVSDPQPDIKPFDTPKPQGQQAHHNMQDKGGGSPDGSAEEEMEPIFTPFAGDKQLVNADDGDAQKADAKQDAIALLEQQLLQELSSRDAEVKAHEQSHSTVGGNLAQSPQFSYEKGSDGRRYAVDGEVQIDISLVAGDPLATVNKMKKVYAAAMAPISPSLADIRVASEALKNLNDAKAQLVDVFTVSPSIELINQQIPSSPDPTSESNTESSSESAPVGPPTGTLSFGTERIAKHYAANAFTEDVYPKADSLFVDNNVSNVNITLSVNALV